MPRKDGTTLKGRQGAVMGSVRPEAAKSWAMLGIDSSLTAISACGVGYDAKLNKRVGPFWGEIRWSPDIDYFERLGAAARGHDLILDILKKMWVIDPARIYIAFEEPFFYGTKHKERQTGSYVKQQAEIAGAFKGSLVRYGFVNLYEITNSQWRAVVRRDGVKITKGPAGKWDIKNWAIKAYGLPDLPDLVKSKSGGKIIRPESGFGAKAKAVQPSDIYDAAAILGWLVDQAEEIGIISE